MKMVKRRDLKLRIKVFDLLNELKGNGMSRKEIVDKLHNEFDIPIGALYDWHSGKFCPYGRRGELTYRAELFYVLGALLGDGCLYNWKITNNFIILVGDKKFTTKYAYMLSMCTSRVVKPYIIRSKNIWFVRSNNFRLYSLFKKIRDDLSYLEQLVSPNYKKSALMFIEGFFDAEGCVKIIKEKVRKTPKIRLDMTNTNYDYLEIIRKLLQNILNIESRYSIQKPELGKDGRMRKKAYHLRIYRKEFVKKFFENISTTKLKEEKIPYVENWLKTKNKTTLKLDCSFLRPASN